MNKVRIAIIDDHKLLREMWARIFVGVPDTEIVGESGTFNEGIEMVQKTRPDILLLDINLQQASGMDAVPLIRKFSPGTRIIVVSMHNQPAYAKQMLRLGAKAYITKNSSHKEILKAVEEAMNGKTYLCTEIKDILSEQVMQEETDGPNIKDLSLREIEVVKKIKEGLSSKEIAAQLHLSQRTVEVHRHNILKKLKLPNTAALINYINTTDLNFL